MARFEIIDGRCVIPHGVTEILEEEFADCQELKDVVIPDTVVNIGMGAFMECHSLQSVTIPRSVTKILAKYAKTPFISNTKRIYLYLGNTSNQKYVDMMKSISRKLQSKENKITGDFVEYEIMLKKLPENAEYYVDIHGFGKDFIYTESDIPIESIRDSEDKTY